MLFTENRWYCTRGIGLAVTKQPPTVTKWHLQSPNGPTAIFCKKLSVHACSNFVRTLSVRMQDSIRSSTRLDQLNFAILEPA